MIMDLETFFSIALETVQMLALLIITFDDNY